MIKLFDGITLCVACDVAIHIIPSVFALKAKQNVVHVQLNRVWYQRENRRKIVEKKVSDKV